MTRLQWVSGGLVLATAVAVGVACRPSAPQPVFELIDPAERVGDLAVGRHELTFRLANRSDRQARVIGLAPG